MKPEDKAAARAAAVAALSEQWPMPVAIRINSRASGWHGEDMLAVMSAKPDMIVVPRAEGKEEVAFVRNQTGKPVAAMIETAKGLIHIHETAREASALIAGTNDLAADLRLPPGAGRGPLQMALQSVVLAARAAGIAVFDGVFNGLEDEQGFAAEAAESRRLGFDGKSLIHPRQIAPCRAAFAPSAEEIARAERLVAAATGGAERFEGRDDRAHACRGRAATAPAPMKRLLPLLLLLLAGCATTRVAPPPPPVSEAEMRATIGVLASDDFEGRMPGTAGAEKAATYIAERFSAAGLRRRRAVSCKASRSTASRPRRRPKRSSCRSGQRRLHRPDEQARRLHRLQCRRQGAAAAPPDGRAVVVMAHYDHLGLCTPEGAADRVCNGAIDNASGVAAVIAVAERVAKMKLDRDVWFVATSAEEWGCSAPRPSPTARRCRSSRIIAGFNLDTIAIAPKGAPVAMVAAKGVALETLVRDSAAAMGRPWDGDDEAASFVQRQDGWALAQRGVPMIMAGGSFSDLKLLERFSGQRPITARLTNCAPTRSWAGRSTTPTSTSNWCAGPPRARCCRPSERCPTSPASSEALANRAIVGMGRYGRSPRRS